MSEIWINVFDEKSASKRTDEFEAELGDDISKDQFWADEIKQFKDNPLQRLNIALKNLPLPAAFREGAIALRAIIRDKRKNKESYDKELSQLYHLAVVRSFMLMYAEKAECPGPNIMESIPGGLIWSLTYSYNEIGYNELELLNKTDIKWLTEYWGEPEVHTTLNKKYKQIWDDYEQKYAENKKKKFENSMAEILELAHKEKNKSDIKNGSSSIFNQHKRKKNKKWWEFWK